MERLAKVMPDLLKCWKEKYQNMYKKGLSFQILFITGFLADGLKEVNMLNMKFQDDHVDISNIGREIDVLVSLLKSCYLGNEFARGSKYLSKFLDDSRDGVLAYQTKDGMTTFHVLRYDSILGDSQKINVQECICLAQFFIQRLISNFDDRYQDHGLFNAAKLFSPKNYSNNLETRCFNVAQFLDKLCGKFNNQTSSLCIDKKKCEGELQRFVLELYEAYPSKGLLDAWEQCCSEIEWRQMFPELYKLWQIVVLLPGSTAICERGFSKQNAIKNRERTCLSLESLDMLMFLCLSCPKLAAEIDWNLVFEAWKEAKARRPQALHEASSSY